MKCFPKFLKNGELFILGNVNQHAGLKYLEKRAFK